MKPKQFMVRAQTLLQAIRNGRAQYRQLRASNLSLWPVNLKAGVVLVALWCCPIVAIAQTSLDDLADEQMSVRELMRLDTALALSQAKRELHARGKTQSGLDTHGLMAQSGALKLLAIYGVGKKLLAEVTVGTQPYLYMRGRSLPVGINSGDTMFRLKGISGSCVQLQRKGESHTLCLHPSLWGG